MTSSLGDVFVTVHCFTAFVDCFLDISVEPESKEEKNKSREEKLLQSLTSKNLHIVIFHITSTATVTIEFLNQVSGEAIKYTSVKHDGCFLNRRSESPHVKAESDSE